MKNNKRMKLNVLLVLFFTSFMMFAQNIEIKGTVKDVNGVPIGGANIIVVGTSTGVQTDFDGNYTITATKGKKLKCSYMGMKTAVKKVGNNSVINFVLEEDLLGLDEVVITGTSGVATKKQLGSSISSLGEKDFSKSKPAVSIGESLQGKVAGAQITRNSGNPSGGMSVKLRGASTLVGSSDPLYIVDGVIVNNNSTQLINLGGYSQNRLVDINPTDIDHIEILKGAAAAAIYGSRASNGVVQIFTKKGKSGKPRISYTTSVNINKLRKKLPYNDAQYKWEDDKAISAKRYDYQDFIFDASYGFENNLNINGGNENTKYSVSGSQYKNQGIVKNTDFDRKTFRLRLDQKLYDWVSLSAGTFVSKNTSNDMPNGKNYGPITSLIFADNIKDVNPDEFGNYPNIGWMPNPLEALHRIKASTNNNRSITDIQVKLTPFEGLRANYTFGYDHSNSEGLLFIPNGFNTKPNGVSEKGTSESSLINSDFNASYQFNITDDLRSTTGAGYSYQYEEHKSFGVKNDKVSELPGIIVTDPSSAVGGSDYRKKASYWGGFLQQSFAYKNKLFLTLAGRLDGASTFGEDERQQFYPKVSGSYALSDEEFFQNTFGSIINSFKIRSAWGQAGNLTALNPYQIYTNYNPSVYGGNTAFTPATIRGNEQLKPERQTEFEVGFDASFFDSRLSLEFSYYQQKIEDLLISRPLSPSTGFDTQFANIGTMENKGVELLVKAIPVKTEHFSWSISGTFSKNKNITPYIEGVKLGLGMFGSSVAQSGEPLGVFYGTFFATDKNGNKILDGNGNVQRAKGYYEYKELNNGQKVPVAIQDYDTNGQPKGTVLKKIVGNPNPDFTASIVNNFEYKNFGLMVQFDVSQGNDVLSWDKRMAYLFAGGKFKGDELKGFVPKGSVKPNFNIYESFVEDGSYIKLREVSLSYNLVLDKPYLKNVKFALSGSNLISFDNYYGFDPEVNTGGQQNGVIGQDMANVPIPAVYKMGVTFNF